MWQSVICCLLAGLLMWIPDWFGVMNVWTLLVPAALFFRCRGCCFRWRPAAQWNRSPSWRAPRARWSAVCKTLVPACWRRSLRCCRKPVRAAWVVDDLNGIVDRVLATAGDADVASGAACLSHVTAASSSAPWENDAFIRSRITAYAVRSKNKTPDSPHIARCLASPPERAGTADASRTPGSHGASAGFRHTIFVMWRQKAQSRYD